MPSGKDKGGRPRVLTRTHRIQLPDELLALMEGIKGEYHPTAVRVAGAALTAAGVFLLTMATAAMMKQVIQDVFRFGTTFAFKTINFFVGWFKASTFHLQWRAGTKEGEQPVVSEEQVQSFSEQVVDELEKRLPGVTMLSISTAITAGGMVLAGQNPAELVKGIAAMIDAIIPG